MIRNSLYNSYLPEAQKGRKQKEIKEGIYKMPIISNRHIFYYDPKQKQWYRKDTNPNAEIVDWQKVPNIRALIDGKKGLNYYASLKNKEGNSPYLLQESAPENFKPIEDKGLIATDLGMGNEVTVPVSEIANIIPSRNKLFFDNLEKEEQNLKYNNQELPYQNIELPEPPIYSRNEPEIKPENFLDLGNNTYVYKDGDKWYNIDSGNEIYDPEVKKGFDKLFEQQLQSVPAITDGKDKFAEQENQYYGGQPFITKEDIEVSNQPNVIIPTNNVVKSPGINVFTNQNKFVMPETGKVLHNPEKFDKNLYIYQSPNNEWKSWTPNRGWETLEGDEKNITLRMLTKEGMLDEKGNISDEYVLRPKSEYPKNKLYIIDEYLSDVRPDITKEYSPVIVETPTEKKRNRLSFEFPEIDFGGMFRRKDRKQPELKAAEIQGYNEKEVYNPENVSTFPTREIQYMPSMIEYTPNTNKEIAQIEYTNTPETPRIVKRVVDVEAPGGMGLLPIITKSNMKNRNKQYGGELTDDDFDYTMDVDVNDLVNYLKGGRLPKAQDSYNFNNPPVKKDAKDILSIENYLKDVSNLEQDTNPFYNPLETLSNEQMEKEIGNITSTPSWATSGLNSLNTKVTTPFVPTSLPRITRIENPNARKIKFNVEPGIGAIFNPTQTVEEKNIVYDPYKIYEPSNQRQYQAMFSPYLYNLGKAFDPNLVYPTETYTPMPIREYALGPNYMALNEADAKLRQAINEQVDTGSRRLNTLIGTSMQIAKQKGDLARLAEADRLKAKEKADLTRAAQQKELDRVVDANKLSRMKAMLTQEGMRAKLAEQTEKLISEQAKALAKEKADRLKLSAMNRLSKDYDIVYNPQTGEDVLVHKGTGYSMTFDEFNKRFGDITKKTQEESKKDAENKTAATEASIKAKENQDKNKTTTGTNKYGGWIKENQPIKKRRNRLYY